MSLDNNMHDEEYDLLDEATELFWLVVIGIAIAYIGGLALGHGAAVLDRLLAHGLDDLIAKALAWPL